MSIRDPRTKEEFLNRLLSADFSGDVRDLAADRKVTLSRGAANSLNIFFHSTGQMYRLVVQKPRNEEQLARLRATREARESITPVKSAGHAPQQVHGPEPGQQATAPPRRRRRGGEAA